MNNTTTLLMVFLILLILIIIFNIMYQNYKVQEVTRVAELLIEKNK
jgi:hypothetical protein